MADERDDGGVAPLAEKVLGDARREAAAIVAQARERAERRLREAEEAARRIEEEASDAGRAEGERAARRARALADVEARQLLLRARAAQVERTLVAARRRLVERMEASDAGRFLAGLVAAGARVLGVRGFRVRLQGRYRAQLEAVLGDAETTPVLEETEDAEPGVTVLSLDGRLLVDMTVGGLFRRRAREAWRAAAQALFDGERSP